MGLINRRSFLGAGAAAVAGALTGPTCQAGFRQHMFGEYAGAILVPGPPPVPEPGSFTIAVLPDTQHYSALYQDLFFAQTDWIVKHRQTRNIAAVLHLGDITDHNTPEEWDCAAQALRRLDGHVPYFLTLGNHDYSEMGQCSDRSTRFNEYFPLANYRDRPEFGGVYDQEPDRLENNYHCFTAGGRDFLVLCLEFGPRNDVVRWANDVVSRHCDHSVILVTHAFTYSDCTRYNWKRYGQKQHWNPHEYGVARASHQDVCDGEELWQKLICPNPNFIMTMNGHVLNSGVAHATTPTPQGRRIPQMLANFQMKPSGGDGWIRLLEFKLNGRMAQACDYSPTLNLCNHTRTNRFAVSIPT